jgi:hypothetical protein
MTNEITTNPSTAAVPGVAAVLSAKLLYDICGPTAKYLGGKFANYTEIGVQDLERVFQKQSTKQKDKFYLKFLKRCFQRDIFVKTNFMVLKEDWYRILSFYPVIYPLQI